MAEMNMPAGFGGLMRYKEEYKSRFMLSPGQVIGYIMLLVLLSMVLRVFWPLG